MSYLALNVFHVCIALLTFQASLVNGGSFHLQGKPPKESVELTFKKGYEEQGNYNDGSNYWSQSIDVSDGTQMGQGVTIYRSKSQFKKAMVLVLNGNAKIIEQKSLLDGKGKKVGLEVLTINEGEQKAFFATIHFQKQTIHSIGGPYIKHVTEFRKTGFASK